MSLSNYLENWYLNQLFTTKTIHVGYATAVTESGATEPTGSGYARELFGAYTLTSVAADVQEVTNDADIVFDIATGSQGTITHICFFDALTGGNFLGSVSFASLSQSNVLLISGGSITLPAGDCAKRMD